MYICIYIIYIMSFEFTETRTYHQLLMREQHWNYS